MITKKKDMDDNNICISQVLCQQNHKRSKNMSEIDFSKVGLKMKQLRNERGITQEQVARDLDCTVPFVSNVENNRAKLNLRVLLYYSKLCNVSVDTILDAGRDLPPLTEKEKQQNDELLSVFRGFSIDEKEKIIKTLRIWQEK